MTLLQIMDTQKIFGIAVYAPEARHIGTLRRALTYLKHHTPSAFREVTRRLRAIVVIPRRGYYNETFVREKLWATESSLLTGKFQYLASLLIHEAHHIAQFEAGKPYRGNAAEKEAYHKQRAFLRRIGYM